jgi:hypothetical protein
MRKQTMKTLLIALALVSFASIAQAQTPATPKSNLAWDQDAPTLAVATGYEYAVYIDAAPRLVVAATCTGVASPFACQTPIPAMTPGDHSLAVTASDNTSVPGVTQESLKSTAFPVRLFLAPQVPKGLRISIQ